MGGAVLVADPGMLCCAGFNPLTPSSPSPNPPRLRLLRLAPGSVLGRCVLKMDHYCIWVVNTVGLLNYKAFLLFMAYAFLASLVATAALVRPMLGFFTHMTPSSRCRGVVWMGGHASQGPCSQGGKSCEPGPAWRTAAGHVPRPRHEVFSQSPPDPDPFSPPPPTPLRLQRRDGFHRSHHRRRVRRGTGRLPGHALAAGGGQLHDD